LNEEASQRSPSRLAIGGWDRELRRLQAQQATNFESGRRPGTRVVADPAVSAAEPEIC
jgi:hypothetical protein